MTLQGARRMVGRIGRTRAVFLAHARLGSAQLPIRKTLCQLERPVRRFCGIRLADHRPKVLGWDEILQAFATAAFGRAVRPVHQGERTSVAAEAIGGAGQGHLSTNSRRSTAHTRSREPAPSGLIALEDRTSHSAASANRRRFCGARDSRNGEMSRLDGDRNGRVPHLQHCPHHEPH